MSTVNTDNQTTDAQPSVPASATAATALPSRIKDSAGLAVTQGRVLRSEWLKLRTVRSWMIMIVATAALLIAFGALAASVASGAVTPQGPNGQGGSGGGFGNAGPTAISLAGVTLAQLIAGILGVLFISNEYANGMIRSTFAAVPRRLPVLWAKVIVIAVVLTVVMVIASLAAFLLGQLILGDGKNTTLAADGVLRAVLGSGLYLAGIGVFGVAIGALLRNTAGSIAVVVAALLIIPGLARLVLPESWDTNVTPYLPSNAGSAFTSVNGSATLLSAGAGAAVFVGWLVVLLAGAAVMIRRRDA
jgi:ABC-type transport system involved in multi-copper enzyme maturation permease subunit